MKLGNARIIGVTMALLVGVLAVAAPWCLAPRCTEMTTGATRAVMTVDECAAVPGHSIAADCDGMRPGSQLPASTAAKAPSLAEAVAVAISMFTAPAPAVSAVAAPRPAGDPPRLVLDTSRLRI